MIYTDKTIKALKLCYDAYIEQYDSSGFPYVFHPFHLAEQMEDEKSTVVALLHYVTEDTDLSYEEINNLGFDDEVVEILRILERDRNTSYRQYLDAIRENDCASKVILRELEYKKELLERKHKLNFDDINRLESYNSGIEYIMDKSTAADTEPQIIDEQAELVKPAEKKEAPIKGSPARKESTEKKPLIKKIISYSTETNEVSNTQKNPPVIKLTDPDITKRAKAAPSSEKQKKREPDRIVYEGKTYIRYSEKWADTSYIIVPETLQRKLNSIFADTIDFSSMRFEHILEEADKYKESSSYTLAIKYYEYAILKGGEKNARIIFPRITSCYRRSGQSKKAIELYEMLCKRYGSSMVSAVLLTSVAAAFCDLGRYQEARKCCDRAFAMLDGKAAPELNLVYQRLKKEGY